jgi:hypothetical protein
MRKKVLIVTSVIIVILLGLFITVAFFPNIYINTGKINSFQEKINSQYEGLQVNLNANTFKASYDSGLFNKTHYKLKLKDASIQVSMDLLRKHLPEEILEEYSNMEEGSNILLSVSRLKLIYGPFDKYLAVKDLRGIKVLTYTNNIERDEGIKGEIDKIKTNKIDLSPLLENEYNNFREAYTDILINNPDYEVSIANVNIQLKNNDVISNLVFEKLKFDQETSTEIARLMNNKSDKDIEEILKSGKEKQISKVSLSGAKLNTLSDNSSYNYALDSMSFTSSFEPQASNFMAYRVALKLGGLALSAEGDEKTVNTYKMLDGLVQFDGSFAIENITPKLAKNYMNLIKYSRAGAASGVGNFQELAGYLSALMASIKEAKPKILLDVNPLKHKLLEAYIDGDLAFTENSNIPLGVINIKSTSLDELENDLAENDILNENSMNIIRTIKGYLKKSDNNMYAATVEIKNQMPYIFINGQPLTGPQLQPSMPDTNTNPFPQIDEGVK